MKKILVLLVAVLITAIILNAQEKNENFPKTVNFTDNIWDRSGQPINGYVDINFKIFKSQTSDSVLWSEDQKNVYINYGYISINLGTKAPLHIDFIELAWLEVKVGDCVFPRKNYPFNRIFLEIYPDSLIENNYKKKQEMSDSIIKIDLNNSIPAYGTFISVDEPPKIKSLVDLYNLIVYPDVCKRSCSGEVIVAVWIDKLGKPSYAKIIYSQNPILNQASIDAVMKYDNYISAMLKGQPVACWLQIPILFNL